MSDQKSRKRKFDKERIEDKEESSDEEINEVEEVPLKGTESGKSDEEDDEDDDDDETEESEDNDDDEESEEEEEENFQDKKDQKKKTGAQTFLPGGTVKVHGGMYCDESAYSLYHRADIGYSCLSCDIIHDSLGDNRDTFPLTCYIAAGTQDANSNNIIVMKMSNLHAVKIKHGSDDDDDDASDDSYDGDADWAVGEEEEDGSRRRRMKMSMMKHPGAVNRIRTVNVQGATLAATWSETGKVYVWSLMESLKEVEKNASKKKELKSRSLHCFDGHTDEGFAIDWSPTTEGRLSSGDCKGGLHTWTMTSEGTWVVDRRSLIGHSDSVEDLQWSPVESNVLASCSVDKSIRIWDVRCDPAKACKLTIADAHDSDVNVISWNKLNSKFVASGGDDGVIKIWDLTMLKNSTSSSSARFKHHNASITSLHWHPCDSSVLAASGEDDQVTIWDVAMEAVVVGDGGGGGGGDGGAGDDDDVLPQLLFVHRGQREVKEVRWHAQVPGLLVSTAHDGLNVFKTANV